MSGDRKVRALLVHALGWAVLLATAFAARSDAIGTGWLAWLGLTLGTLLFVGLTTHSGMQMLSSIRAADRASVRLFCPSRRASVTTWPTHRPYGTTTIRPRSDIARR